MVAQCLHKILVSTTTEPRDGFWGTHGRILARVGSPLDRVPVPVIPIQGRTLLQCKTCGSIRKFEAPYL